jgi:hypothetical protein
MGRFVFRCSPGAPPTILDRTIAAYAFGWIRQQMVENPVLGVGAPTPVHVEGLVPIRFD